MYIRKKKYPSGNLGIIVVEKVDGKMKELATIGFAKTDDKIENRGSRMHLLRGIESLQGTGASAQTLRDKDGVDKVLALAQTIVTIQINLPQNKETISKTMLMKRHQRIAPLFTDEFWVTR